MKYHVERKFKCDYVENGITCTKAYITNHLLQQHIKVKLVFIFFYDLPHIGT
jgi:hypothetical protein